MSVPALAAIVLGVVLYNQSRPTKKVVREAQTGMMPGGHALTRPTGPSQMWVDRPQNTVLRDDTVKGGLVEDIDAYIRSTYKKEAECHPGVQLVAGGLSEIAT